MHLEGNYLLESILREETVLGVWYFLIQKYENWDMF